MNIPVYGQRQEPWQSQHLGTSQADTIHDYGCTICCIAMFAGITPDEVNRRMIAAGAFVSGDLVNWTKLHDAIPWIDFVWKGTPYDNDAVVKAISDYGACIVEVDFDGKFSTPNDHHFVLFTGNHQLHDPWYGQTMPTSQYSVFQSYVVLKRLGDPQTTTPTPPANPPANNGADMYNGLDLNNKDAMKVCVDDHNAIMSGVYVHKTDVDAQLVALQNQISQLNGENTQLKQDKVQLNAEMAQIKQEDTDAGLKELEAEKARDKALGDLKQAQADLEAANKTITGLNGKVSQLTDELAGKPVSVSADTYTQKMNILIRLLDWFAK